MKIKTFNTNSKSSKESFTAIYEKGKFNNFSNDLKLTKFLRQIGF